MPGAGGVRRLPGGFPLREAILLGLVHGPAELLPVSSSGHITLIAWLFDLSYSELAPEIRKDFEVALHAGTAAALLIGARSGLGEAAWAGDRRAAGVLGLALVPPALAGLGLESRIERLGTPGRIAAGLLVGALALALADRLGSSGRRADDAGPLDGLLLGLAQAAALVPGISRNGATLAVCRGRGFGREAAEALSRDCGLPIMLGASAVRAARLTPAGPLGVLTGGPTKSAIRARPSPSIITFWGFTSRSTMPASCAAPSARTGSRLACGAAAAFVSTVLARGLLDRRDRPVSLPAAAAYRTALAGVVLVRLVRSEWCLGRSGTP